jgi:intein/homing endonuclease
MVSYRLTFVETRDGERPIASIKVGDQVFAYNSATGKEEYETVDAVLVHTDPVTEDLTISGEVIHTTPEHPFYTLDRGWVNADNLKRGEMVKSADGRYGVVQAIVVRAKPQVMYNLTVHGDHTFFVGAGEWLVHN